MNVPHDYINASEGFQVINSVQGRTVFGEETFSEDAAPVHYKSASNLSSSALPPSSPPYQSMTLDRAKHLKNRHEVKPPPPPPPVKSPKTRLSDGRPIPPPKPTTLKRPPRSYPSSPAKPPPPPKRQDAGGAYSNVIFGNGSPPGLLDLSSRDSRGSAFELYRKEDSHQRLPSEEAQSVIASARGVFGCEGGTLWCRETGVRLVVPPGAIAEGEMHEIYFKVCHDDSMLPPLDRDKGETLLSPLVMCGPHGLRFRVPIELRLPHCASLSPDSWSFALKASDTPNGEPAEWQNLDRDGVTSSRVENDYVSVLVDHF